MEIAIQILKNRLQSLKDIRENYKDRNTYHFKPNALEELKIRINEVEYNLQRLEIEGRRKKIEEKEFQDSLGRL